MKLSILICTLPKRIEMYNELIACLTKQIDLLPADLINPIEIVSCSNEFISIGEKRNLLLNEANGDYICFIDDDDIGMGIQDEMGADLLLGDSNMYSCDNDIETRQKSSKTNQESNEMIAKRRNQKEEERIVARFRVISAADVEAMLAGKTVVE
jgi:hypothetical protein